MRYRANLEVHIPSHKSVTTVGIGVEHYASTKKNLLVFPLSPCCEMTMVYHNSRDPHIRCEKCSKTYTDFPHLEYPLLHSGLLKQCLQLESQELTLGACYEVSRFIERWTGLTDIEFSVTL